MTTKEEAESMWRARVIDLLTEIRDRLESSHSHKYSIGGMATEAVQHKPTVTE